MLLFFSSFQFIVKRIVNFNFVILILQKKDKKTTYEEMPRFKKYALNSNLGGGPPCATSTCLGISYLAIISGHCKHLA